MITKAPAGAWEKIEALRQSVIDGLTIQPSNSEVVAAARAVLGNVVVMVVECPVLATFLATAQFSIQLYGQLRDQLRDQLSGQLYGQLRDQLSGQLDGQLYGQLYGQLDDQLRDQLSGQLYGQLYDQLSIQLYGQLRDQLRDQLGKTYLSVWWRTWSAWYEGAKMLGVKFDTEKYEKFLSWTRCCPFISFASEKLVYVSRWPTEIHWENNLLHNDSGPSVAFGKGFRIWTIDGIPVNEQIVMHPETQTIKEIDAEQNQDVRSIRIRRFGWPRYLKESGAVVQDSRKNDVEGTLEALYFCQNGDRRLVATCPTGRIFAMGVPPNVETCEAAQQWLGGGEKMNVIGAT